jgi:hypothetical protein
LVHGHDTDDGLIAIDRPARARELERGNPNRATLAVARKMVIYMLAVERRQQDWVPAEQFICTTAA